MDQAVSTSKFLSEAETREILDLLLECDDPQDVKDRILGYYKTDRRHRYSFIAIYIMSKADDPKLDIQHICIKLQTLIDKMPENSNDRYKLEKLHDHVNLEIVRVDSMKSIKSSISESENRILNVDRKNQNIQKELANSRTQYITTFGVFASIVITFMAGISFSNAVLSNIGKAPFYQLILIMCFITFFVGNILLFLYGFIKNINKIEIKANKLGAICFNGVIFLIAIIIAIVHSLKIL